MVQNKGLIFTKIPTGMPVAGEHLQVQDRPLDLAATAPPTGGLLTQNLCISFDPYQRGRMRDASEQSYVGAYPLDTAITNTAVVRVLKSDAPDVPAGALARVHFFCPTEEYSLIGSEHVAAGMVHVLANPHGVDARHFVGALGMPGLTAYSSFKLYAGAIEGAPARAAGAGPEVLFVSSAAGAVGQLVGQLARRAGMRTVGSVGDAAKVAWATGPGGFDAAFNYKEEAPAAALARLAPGGIDVYYDNVGGEHLEAAIDAMRDFGRIVVCGMISQYNAAPAEAYPIRNLTAVTRKRLRMQGFIVSDPHTGARFTQEHQDNVGRWIADGSFPAKISEVRGIDAAAEGFVGMLQGKNFGKCVLVIKDLDDTADGKGGESSL